MKDSRKEFREIAIDPPRPPAELVTALTEERFQYRLEYTNVHAIYHVVWTWSGYCGVFGDGPNAAYEWFIWDGEKKTLETSNCGYGSTHVALRDVLNEVEKRENA